MACQLMVFIEDLLQCDLVYKVFGVLSSSPTIYIYVDNNKLYKCLFCCYITEILTINRQPCNKTLSLQPDIAIMLCHYCLLIFTQVVICLRQRLSILAFMQYLTQRGGGHTE